MSRRSHFWAAVASVGILAVLLTMAATFVSFHEEGAADGGEQAALAEGRGQIVQVGSGGCSKIEFDNRSGHFGDRQSIPCPEGRMLKRDYHYPSKRFEQFSQGFTR